MLSRDFYGIKYMVLCQWITETISKIRPETVECIA